MGVMSAYKTVGHLYAWCPGRPERWLLAAVLVQLFLNC